MSDVTIEKLMSKMPGAFVPEKAVGIDAVLQFHLTGEEASDWIVTIKDGGCSVTQGVAENPDSQDYKDVILGNINGMNAFMDGKLQLSGDLNLAMKLTSMFKMN